MKIINDDGDSMRTKVLSNAGEEMADDLCITEISIDISVNENIKARLMCLAPKFSVEVLPENVTMIQDTELLDAAITQLQELMTLAMFDDVREKVNNIHAIITKQLNLLE